jgi:hypothetical protein
VVFSRLRIETFGLVLFAFAFVHIRMHAASCIIVERILNDPIADNGGGDKVLS